MSAPISRLSADLWSQVTAALNYDDIKNLLMCGDRQLMQVVGHKTEVIRIDTYIHALDLECVLRTLQATPNVQELHLNPKAVSTRVMKPLLTPLRMPPKLTSLSALFFNSVDFFLVTNDIASLAPSLTSLNLSGKLDSGINMSVLKLPPKLSALQLHTTSLVIGSGDIAQLPRSLTFMQILTGGIPSMTHYEWPPELATLNLSGLTQPLHIENLPRTATSLQIYCSLADLLTTSFKTSKSADHLAFPWRRFFPSLTRLRLNIEPRGSAEDCLKSFICHDAYQAEEIEAFISNGPWQLPTPPTLDSKPSYPLFECLAYPKWKDDGTDDACKALTPLLTKVSVFCSLRYPSSVLPYLPSMRSFTGDMAHHSAPTDELPTHLTDLSGTILDVPAIERMTSLTALAIRNMPTPELSAPVKWPPALIRLSSSIALTGPALQSLPLSLTRIATHIKNQADWTTLATTLPSLQSLSIVLDPLSWDGWNDDAEPLTPISGLSDFSIKFEKDTSDKVQCNRPYLDEFFGNHSPLPACLTKLSINSFAMSHRVPFTVFPSLPRQLRELSVMGYLDTLNENFGIDFDVATMTSSHLLASLPAGLDSLELMHYTSIERARLSTESLKSLPRGLKRFHQNSLWSPSALDLSDAVAALPPKLSALNSSGSHLESAYFKSKAYLYDGW